MKNDNSVIDIIVGKDPREHLRIQTFWLPQVKG